MINSLLRTYEKQREFFNGSEEVSVQVWKLDTFVDYIKNLENEKAQFLQKLSELEQKNAALEDRIRYLIEERDGLEWALNFSGSEEYCE